MRKRYFAGGLVIQSTHDNAAIPDTAEVTESDHLSFLDSQRKEREAADVAERELGAKLKETKIKAADAVYSEALEIGFSPDAAQVLAESVFSGWSLEKKASQTRLTKLPAVGKVTAERLQQAGYVTFAQVSAMSLEEWLQFGTKAQHQKVIDAAKALT